MQLKPSVWPKNRRSRSGACRSSHRPPAGGRTTMSAVSTEHEPVGVKAFDGSPGTLPEESWAGDPTFWDGRVHSYRPAHDWLTRVAPKLQLHTEATEALDPVTFEVIRNRLWTINLAHGETLTRISG